MKICIEGTGETVVGTLIALREQSIPYTILFGSSQNLCGEYWSSNHILWYWTSSKAAEDMYKNQTYMKYTLIVRERDITLLKLISSADIEVL